MAPTLKLVFTALALSSYWTRIFLTLSLSFPPFSPCPNTISISFFFHISISFPKKAIYLLFTLLYNHQQFCLLLRSKEKLFFYSYSYRFLIFPKSFSDFHRVLEMLQVHLLLRSDSRFKTIIDAKSPHQFLILLTDPCTYFRFGFGSTVHAFFASLLVRFSLYTSCHMKLFLASSTPATGVLR